MFKKDFPEIELKHQLADSLSLMMVKAPTMFNGVIHTDNTFGDMLSDQAGGVVSFRKFLLGYPCALIKHV
jgi:3-isopropylmalate dehydrogenase